MGKRITFLGITLISFAALAAQHESAGDEVRAAAEAFNKAYATNDIEGYFGRYDDDATVYFYGARQDLSAYHKMWSELMDAGVGVEKNEMSDLVVQIMPGAEIAVTTYFVDNRIRFTDGEVATARAFETDVWRKTDGEWKVVSLHFSEVQ